MYPFLKRVVKLGVSFPERRWYGHTVARRTEEKNGMKMTCKRIAGNKRQRNINLLSRGKVQYSTNNDIVDNTKRDWLQSNNKQGQI
jgi:hypothetical protein